MDKPTVHARPRTVIGKKVKTLRKQGLLPANVYGHNVESQALQLDAHAFSLLQRHLSASSIIDLAVEGAPARRVMIHRTQRDVRTGRPSHIEFFQINPLERLTATVPLVLTGEPELVTRQQAVLLQEMTQIEVSSLPDDLPQSIEVSSAALDHVGASIHVRDLPFDRAKLHIKAHEDDLVASLTAPQAYAEEEAPTAAEQPEEGAAAEGEGAAGEASPEA